MLTQDEEKKVAELIGRVEAATTGEICLHLARKLKHKAIMNEAAVAFRQHGLDRTEHRNAVLIFVAVKDRQLAIIGDKGIHDIVGENGWTYIAAALKEAFKAGKNFEGITKAIESVATVLHKHFPGKGPHQNELPNEVGHS